jgi:creatinine amidohydrolase
MHKLISLAFALFMFVGVSTQNASAQALSYQYEELTGPDFIKAVQKSEGVCILPIGILEKHGPHLPIGSDILGSRAIATQAAGKEYCVVFPTYYFGQINEARHQPGTISYSPETIWNLLQETCSELSRNGFKKIIIVNGHGGNNDFLHYFCMSQLHSQKDYSLILFQVSEDSVMTKKIEGMRKTTTGGHADEVETATIMAIRPDLVKIDQATTQSGVDQIRLESIPFQYTGIWWYARYPNHYAGDGSKSTVELGKTVLDFKSGQLVKLIQTVKKSNKIEELQNQFYQQAADPLKTKQ